MKRYIHLCFGCITSLTSSSIYDQMPSLVWSGHDKPGLDGWQHLPEKLHQNSWKRMCVSNCWQSNSPDDVIAVAYCFHCNGGGHITFSWILVPMKNSDKLKTWIVFPTFPHTLLLFSFFYWNHLKITEEAPHSQICWWLASGRPQRSIKSITGRGIHQLFLRQQKTLPWISFSAGQSGSFLPTPVSWPGRAFCQAGICGKKKKEVDVVEGHRLYLAQRQHLEDQFFSPCTCCFLWLILKNWNICDFRQCLQNQNMQTVTNIKLGYMTSFSLTRWWVASQPGSQPTCFWKWVGLCLQCPLVGGGSEAI